MCYGSPMSEHYYYHIDYRLSKKHNGPDSADYDTRRNLLRKLSIYEREEWEDIENDDFATSTLDVLSSKEICALASEVKLTSSRTTKSWGFEKYLSAS